MKKAILGLLVPLLNHLLTHLFLNVALNFYLVRYGSGLFLRKTLQYLLENIHKGELLLKLEELLLGRTFSFVLFSFLVLLFPFVLVLVSFVLFFLFSLPFYFATLSPIVSLAVRIAFLMPFDFLQTVHVYITVILLVVLDFLLRFFIGGREYFPLFPVPDVKPLDLSLLGPPRERGCVVDLDLCFATLIFCFVFARQ